MSLDIGRTMEEAICSIESWRGSNRHTKSHRLASIIVEHGVRELSLEGAWRGKDLLDHKES